MAKTAKELLSACRDEQEEDLSRKAAEIVDEVFDREVTDRLQLFLLLAEIIAAGKAAAGTVLSSADTEESLKRKIKLSLRLQIEVRAADLREPRTIGHLPSSRGRRGPAQ